jgi:hypothetical protein
MPRVTDAAVIGEMIVPHHDLFQLPNPIKGAHILRTLG